MGTLCKKCADAEEVYICTGRDFVPGCGRLLTDEERHYYGRTCEDCEREWMERVSDWRSGADDAEIDVLIPTAK